MARAQNETEVAATTHTVIRGDTLAKIAHRYYGDGKMYPFIAEVNKIPNPHLIITGTVLKIPPSPREVLSQVEPPQLEPAIPEASTAAVAALPCVAEPASKPEFVWRKESYQGFNADENLSFQVRWQFITVGFASMVIKGIVNLDGRQAYHVVTEACSAPFFDNFYKVRDINETWIDTESLVSLKYASKTDENNNKKTETILFDQANQQFRIVENGKGGSIPPWVQDVLSALYYIRTQDLAVGRNICVDAHSGDKSWPLNVKVIRKERVKVPAGEFETYVVEPAIRDGAGIFQAKGKLWVWITADARRIPVLVYSMHEDGDYVRRALAAGAQGYVTKREMHRVLTQAIREVAAGRQFLGPRAAAALAADLAQSGARDADHALSDQERRAYHLLGEGGTIAEIADAMHISPRTLESYCQRIMEKLDLTGMSALRRHAIRHLQHESK
jgi:DNA-binding CsgD family transcriptional regulator/LysM repeat protein